MSTIDGAAAWTSIDTPHGTTDSPLHGLRVLDLSRVLAGPYTAQMLADHGADVIKVEGPGGDETRGWGPPFTDDGSASAYFAGLNHSKRNICLDLSGDAGREVLGHLIAGADVVVENFKAGTMARWGLDHDTVLAPRHPQQIYCRITGFGIDGPLGGLPGYDAVLQAFGGLMSVTGYPDRGPLRVGVPIVDMVAANLAFSGILLALYDRTRSGRGQLVDVTLLDAVMSILHPHSANWTAAGMVSPRTGDQHPTVVPYQVFAAADGELFISAANDRQFRTLTEVLGIPDAGTDPRFASNAQRHRHRDALITMLQERIGALERSELADRLEAAGVAASPVHTVDEALTSAQVRHRGLFIDTADYRGMGVPITLSRSTTRSPSPAVARGTNTDEILDSMGYSAARIVALRAAGAFGGEH